MVTGDMKITARAIAKECGIIKAGDEESLVLEGVEFMEKVYLKNKLFIYFIILFYFLYYNRLEV